MSSDKTAELLSDICREIDYFDAKPHKISRNRDLFMECIINYGQSCREEVIEILKDKLK